MPGNQALWKSSNNKATYHRGTVDSNQPFLKHCILSLKIGPNPEGNYSIPTIHFQVRHISLGEGIFLDSSLHLYVDDESYFLFCNTLPNIDVRGRGPPKKIHRWGHFHVACGFDKHLKKQSMYIYIYIVRLHHFTKWCNIVTWFQEIGPTGPTFLRPRKKPEYLIARSQLTGHGVRWDSVPCNFWWNGNLVGGFNPSEKY